MKNYLIVLFIFLTSFAHAYQVTYRETVPQYGYCPCKRAYNGGLYRQNSYMPQYNPYYMNYTVPNYRPVFRNFQRKKTTKFKKIGFFDRNKGNLTGYSVPVNKDDMYKQMGISPYDPNKKQRYNSINCNQDLFSSPMGDEMYYKNGEYYKDLKGTSGKSGVTIIYD